MSDQLILQNIHGRQAKPTIIDGCGMAVNGGGMVEPVVVDCCSNLVIRDVLACNSVGHVYRITNCDNVLLELTKGWNASPTANACVYKIDHCRNIVLGAPRGWGSGRKIYELTFSDDCLLEEAWGRWELSERTDPKMVYAIAYNSLRNRAVRCIGECHVLPPASAGPMQAIFGADNTWAIGSVPSQCVADDCTAIATVPVRAFVPGETCKIKYERCRDLTIQQAPPAP